jgi:hypothetical protein
MLIARSRDFRGHPFPEGRTGPLARAVMIDIAEDLADEVCMLHHCAVGAMWADKALRHGAINYVAWANHESAVMADRRIRVRRSDSSSIPADFLDQETLHGR